MELHEELPEELPEEQAPDIQEMVTMEVDFNLIRMSSYLSFQVTQID
jgi:hypothetical protein